MKQDIPKDKTTHHNLPSPIEPVDIEPVEPLEEIKRKDEAWTKVSDDREDSSKLASLEDRLRLKYLQTSGPDLESIGKVINNYTAKLSKNPNMYMDVLEYFKALKFISSPRIYKTNEELYSMLVGDCGGDIIKSEVFQSAFFAYNCIEVGNLINDYNDSKLSDHKREIAQKLINDLAEHQSFLERCRKLSRNGHCHKYFFLGTNRLRELIAITKRTQASQPIDEYLSQFNIQLNYDDKTYVPDFIKKIDVALFMHECRKNNLKGDFDEIYEAYGSGKCKLDKALLYKIKDKMPLDTKTLIIDKRKSKKSKK